jgi:polyisoprenoid-binding protein YceI
VLSLASGCNPAETTASGSGNAGSTSNSATNAASNTTTPAANTSGSTAAAADGIALTASNAMVGFVGTHEGKNPDPDARVGSFEKFTGKIEVDAANKSIKSLTLDIDVNSLKTGMDKLDDHLRTEDFFDVRTHPTAKFVLKEAKASAAGGSATHDLTGDLTLMGNTKSVTIPATVEFTGATGAKITGETKIKRSEFGMGKMTDKVSDEVTIKLTVGG